VAAGVPDLTFPGAGLAVGAENLGGGPLAVVEGGFFPADVPGLGGLPRSIARNTDDRLAVRYVHQPHEQARWPAASGRLDRDDVLPLDELLLDVEMVDALRIVPLADLGAVDEEREGLVGRDVDGGLVHDTGDIESPAEVTRLGRRLLDRVALVEPDPLDATAALGVQTRDSTETKSGEENDPDSSTGHGLLPVEIVGVGRLRRV